MPTLTLQQAAAYARAAGFTGDNLVDIVAVATPESSLSTTVVNSIGCVGVWQINQPVHVKDHPGWTRAWLQDPANNAAAAKVVFDQQGMSAWQAWTDGSAQSYLPAARTAVAAVGGGSATGTVQSAALTSATDTTATQASVLGDVVGGTVDAVTFMGNLTKVLIHTTEWLTNPANWIRIVQVLIGGGLVLVGMEALGKPIIAPAVQTAKKTAAVVTKVAAVAA